MPSQTFRSFVRWGLVAIASATIVVASRSAAQPISYTFTIIDVPGASSTEAHGVNGLGQVVGRFTDATGEHGFLKDGDTFTTIDVPFGDLGTTRANGINATGKVVGRF